jgi:hypothetical protein
MSVVEDMRQVLQDFIAPELRAVNQRFDGVNQRFEGVNQRFDAIDQRFDDMAAMMNTRFDSLSKEVAQVKDMLEIDRRLTRLESKQSQVV